ncbi:MAG: hypothetical protein MJZ06_05785 [Bacteroidaceae bacterium]|nr:hypothetical protein [Bacteroidaceae bacterium]
MWTIDFYRKHTYAGVVRGLGGVPSSVEPVNWYDPNVGRGHSIYSISGTALPEGADLESLPEGFYIIDGHKVVNR